MAVLASVSPSSIVPPGSAHWSLSERRCSSCPAWFTTTALAAGTTEFGGGACGSLK
jgi:hypothetical protein